MKFLSVKSTHIPVGISILLILIKTIFIEQIWGYDWGSFPMDATYSVFAFYIWFFALYSAKEDLLEELGTLKISKNKFDQIKKIVYKIFTIGKKTKRKYFPLIILGHFFLYGISFSTYVCNLARSMCILTNPLLMILTTLIIVYFFPVLLAQEWI